MYAKKGCKGQIAIEFLLMMSIAFAVVIIFLLVALSLFKNHNETRTYEDLDDLGKALQQEFLLAAQLEDGYLRDINLPLTLNGLIYNVTLRTYNNTYSYISLEYDSQEIYYAIPLTNGTLALGDNQIEKINGTLYVSTG